MYARTKVPKAAEHPSKTKSLLQSTAHQIYAKQISSIANIKQPKSLNKDQKIRTIVSSEDGLENSNTMLDADTLDPCIDTNGYQFKPPAAAKYFLWDSTRIGKTFIIHPKNLMCSYASISNQAFKAISMQMLKRDLMMQPDTSSEVSEHIDNQIGFLIGNINGVDSVISFECFDLGTVKPNNPTRFPGSLSTEDIVSRNRTAKHKIPTSLPIDQIAIRVVDSQSPKSNGSEKSNQTLLLLVRHLLT